MSKKHVYIININGGSKEQELLYNYSTTKNVSLRIGMQQASIAYQKWAKWKAEDLVSFKDKLFRDAFRKVYLLHALIKNQGLVIHDIEVVVDNVSTHFDKTTTAFPFMYSMIIDEELNLSDKWKEIIPEVISIPKSKMDTDLRFVALFSYLSSRSKKFLIEQFTDLWTSMNSYYSYIAFNCEKMVKENRGEEFSQALFKKHGIYKNDADSIGMLGKILSIDHKKINRKNADELWKNNYDTEKLLCNYNKLQIQSLYQAAKNELAGEPLPDQYKELAACAGKFSTPLFTYLLLIYPYHWRCDLFHGNRTTLLFSAYNDYEIAVIRTVNYFLETFLNENIPEIFKPDFSVNYYERMEDYLRDYYDFEKTLKKVKL